MSRFLTYEQIADHFSISISFIKKKIQNGTFRLGTHYFKPDGKNGMIRFDVVELEKWMRGKENTHETLPKSGNAVSDVLSRIRPNPKEYRIV